MNPSSSTRRKVVVIGMVDSVHLARWLNNLRERDIDVLLLPSGPHRRIHPSVRLLASETGAFRLQIPSLLKIFSLPIWILDKFLGLHAPIRSFLFELYILQHAPDFIHILETQAGGYPSIRYLKKFSSPKQTVALTLFGSDLFWFGRFEDHRKLLGALFENVDVICIECHRDASLARSLGFKGNFIGPMPAAGIFPDSKSNSRFDLKDRKLILVKGYQNKWGRALHFFDAFEQLDPSLWVDCRIVVYSAEWPVRMRARKFAAKHKISVEVHKKGSLSHSAILDLMAKSRVYVGLSISDGLPSSLLEAMSNGAIPVQSDSSCASDWIQNGLTGFLPAANDIRAIKLALEKAISSDTDWSAAQKENASKIAVQAKSTASLIELLDLYQG